MTPIVKPLVVTHKLRSIRYNCLPTNWQGLANANSSSNPTGVPSSVIAPSVCPDNSFVGNGDVDGDGDGDSGDCDGDSGIDNSDVPHDSDEDEHNDFGQSGFGVYKKSTKPQDLSIQYTKKLKILCWAFFLCDISNAHHVQMISVALQ